MDYTYVIVTDFPGGQFTGGISDRLNALILARITSANLTNISEDGLGNVVVSFDQALSTGDKTILDNDQTGPAGGLIAESCWSLFVTADVSGTVSGVIDSTTVAQDADGIHSVDFTLQLVDGTGSPITGSSDAIELDPSSRSPLTTLSGNLDGSGSFGFTFGPSSERGNTSLSIKSGSLPERTFIVRFE
jgi:hypothetical protein